MTKSYKFFFVIITALYLSLRLIGLGADLTNTDAYRWHKRSGSFLAGLKNLEFKETYQHYQPGVTLMWLNSFTKQALFTYKYHILGDLNPPTIENSDWFPQIHGVSKSVLVLALFAVLIAQMHYVKELFGEKTALIFGFFMAVEPYLIGIDRWFHLTSLEGYLGLAAVLSLLVWNKERSENKLLLVSSLFFALAFLSKITALILLPLILWIILGSDSKNYKLALIYAGGFVASILILFPAVLVAPSYVYQKLYSSIFDAVSGANHVEVANPYIRLAYYDFILFLRSAPITLIVLFASLKNIKKNFTNINYKVVLFSFLTYYLVLTLSQKKIDRYFISMVPTLLLLVSIFLGQISTKNLKIVIAAHLVFLAISTYLFFPIFSSYYSPIFGGTDTAVKLGIYDNSGEYFANAAKYLSPRGRDILTFVPNGMSSFSYYYNGTITAKFTDEVDFVVSSLDQDRTSFENYGCASVEASFGSKEADVVRIFSCEVKP